MSSPRPADANALSARIPSLDGLRAVSIGMVLAYHALFLNHTASWPLAKKLVAGTVANGHFGVQAFFVVSGFLITLLLLRERDVAGRVNLPAFYARRAVRILPAYWTMVLTIAVLAAMGVVHAPFKDVLHALTFTWVYNDGWSWNLSHTWSLSVEEQFYLFWPVAVSVLGPAGGRRLALALIVLTPLGRLGFGLGVPGVLHDICLVLSVGRFDVLMIGGLAAILWHEGRLRRLATTRAYAVVAAVLLACAITLAAAKTVSATVGAAAATLVFGDGVEALGLAAAVVYVVANPHGVVGRCLNCRPMAWAGALSFSLYLWQQLFLTSTPAFAAQRWPWNVACVLAVACASFYGIERPAIRWHKRRTARFGFLSRYGRERVGVRASTRLMRSTTAA